MVKVFNVYIEVDRLVLFCHSRMLCSEEFQGSDSSEAKDDELTYVLQFWVVFWLDRFKNETFFDSICISTGCEEGNFFYRAFYTPSA